MVSKIRFLIIDMRKERDEVGKKNQNRGRKKINWV
ncbi:unnamed protein product [Arabidopsis halleri]